MPTPRKIVNPNSGLKYLKCTNMAVGQVIEGIFLGRTYNDAYKYWSYEFFTTAGKQVFLAGATSIDALFELAGIDLAPTQTFDLYVWVTKTAERSVPKGTFHDFDLDIGDVDDDASSALAAAARAFKLNEGAESDDDENAPPF